MKKYKHLLQFLVPICLLVLIPLAPFALTKWTDERLLETVKVEEITENIQQVSQLKTSQKIALLSQYYGNNNQNIILVSQKRTQLDAQMQDMKSIVNTELSKLQSLNIFPQIDFKKDYTAYNYLTRVYSQATDPEKSVSVNIITYSSQKSAFEIWIDAQTHLIYQYIFYTESTHNYSNKQMHMIFGLDYLKLSNQDIENYYYTQFAETSFSVNIHHLENKS